MTTGPIDPTAIPLPEAIPGERVLLRPWRPGDAAALFAAVTESKERLRPWMPWVEGYRARADAEAYVERVGANWADRCDLALGIWHRESGRLLGATGLHNIDWSVPSFEIGYWIRDGEEGKGYVEESVRLLVRLVFADLGAQRLAITCDAENTRSRRIPERIGFLLEGRLRNHQRTAQGTLRDTLVFALTPEDWQSIRSMESG